MRQFALTLIAQVKDDGLEPLRLVLKNKEAVLKEALGKLGTIHYARWVIIEPSPGYKAQLAFGSNFDGPVEQHIGDLVRELGPLVNDIYSHCVDYSSVDPASYLLNIRTPEAAFYQGSPGRSVKTIADEKALRNRLVRAVQAGNWTGKSAGAIHNELRSQVLAEPEFAWAKEPLKTPGMSNLSWLLLGIVLSPILLPVGLCVLFGFALWALYMQFFHELWNKPGELLPNNISDKLIDDNIREEDFTWQNQFSQVMIMKPGPARLYTLKTFFSITRLLIRLYFVKGKLMGIPTIHFARWVLLDNDKRLMFFSNFDGSWTQYLGDFIDKSGWGLNALFGNTTNFPRIWFFFWRGAYDEMHFLGWSRFTQIPTQVWYAADVSQSIKNINDNTLIRNDLSRNLSDAQAKQFLARLWIMETLEKNDIQGFVLKGYGKMRHTIYVLLHVDDATRAKAWLAQMSIEVTDGNQHPDRTALNVAMSYPGLKGLGLSERNLRQFSREFREGLTEPHRQRLLGDVGEDAPDQWRWGGTNGDARAERVHMLLMVFAADAVTLKEYWDQLKPVVLNHGLSILGLLDGHLDENNKEEFGFKDGISQPQIAGNHPNTRPVDTIAAGEFLLGYKNEYGVLPETPLIDITGQQGDANLLPTIEVDKEKKKDLGRNGSYLVFRQMQQHKEEFWAFMRENSTSEPEAIKLASKMMGRWPSGAALTLHPDTDPGEGNPRYFADNDFGYAGTDKEGSGCPVGSHIRRSNPRDVFEENDPKLSLSLTKKHRIIRRGRSYTFSIAEAAGHSAHDEVGLNFMCFNADISHQFEFLYHTWINFPRFDRLYNDPDPIIGTARNPGPGVEQNFTIPQCPVNRHVCNLKRFVTIRGGVYLFFPSIKAIKYFATI